MKRYILILTLVFATVATLWAKTVNLQPDSYAYTRGVEAYDEQNYSNAMEWFQRELSANPKNGYAYVYISLIRVMNQEYGRAISAIDDALKMLPKKDKDWRAYSFITRANIYLSMGDTVSALHDINKSIQTTPSDYRLYDSRGQLYYELENYALADTDYRKIIDLNQGSIIGYLGIGRNAIAQERWDDAISQLNYVLTLEPEYSRGYSFRAEAYIGKNMWAQATDDIIKALDIDSDDKAFYLMQTLPQEAYEVLKPKLKIQMVKQSTNCYWPYCLAAIAYLNNDFDEAISYYKSANTIDPNYIFLKQIANCYKEKDDYVTALDYTERALAINPEDYSLVDSKADLLSLLGRYDECLIERDRYIALYPDYALGYLSRANDLTNARRFKDVIEDYNTAIAIVPGLAQFPYLLMRRGDAYRLTGDLEKAENDYKALLAAEKDSTLSTDSWTPFAYSGLGDAEKAIETMLFILENDTTDVSGNLYNTACIYGRLNQKSEAIRYLKEAFEKGYLKVHHVETDYDLDCLRDMPEYNELINSRKFQNSTDGQGSQDIPSENITKIVEVPFTKESGVTKVKCSINDLPLHFVFDTGAADVTISMTEASFMLKNDYITPSDIVGSALYVDANGDISEGTIVNLRNVNFGGLVLENVRASVVRNQKAPLLLGQSVLGRLGKIEIDNANMKLIITHKELK